jgi:hypothetical protein
LDTPASSIISPQLYGFLLLLIVLPTTETTEPAPSFDLQVLHPTFIFAVLVEIETEQSITTLG